MATVITSECINCGACEPECPNTAIYQGGVEWEHNGAKHAAISNEIFFIVPEKCTECVGFFDHEACAAVCPVDCCVPDPKIPESEAVLFARAKELHPGEAFADDFPSRFKKAAGAGATSADGAPAAKPAAPSPAAAAGAPAPKPAVAAAAPASAKPAAAPAAPSGARVEKAVTSPPKIVPLAAQLAAFPARKEKSFPGESAMTFEHAMAKLEGRRSGTSAALKAFAVLAQPLLGALPYEQKRAIELAVGDERIFTAAGATGVNVLHNMILYPLLIIAAKAATTPGVLFTKQLGGIVSLGLAIAIAEAAWRMREGVRAMPVDETKYRGALYGLPLGLLFSPLLRTLSRGDENNTVAIDGFHGGTFEEKLERERRYGEVYKLDEKTHGYHLRFEFPRFVPKSAQKEEFGIGDIMPDYDYELSLKSGFFVVKGSVTDPSLRRLAAVSPAFPPDFTTNVELGKPVTTFKHRFVGKTLEVALLSA